jgi:predicted phage tail protein
VTSAAAVMVGVFSIFGTLSLLEFKQLGVGLAAAVLIDATIVRVDFYAGDSIVGSSSTAPFTFTWQATAAGSYALRAAAVDNNGASSMSSSVQVQILAPQRPSITVSFEPSPDHAKLVVGYLLEVRKGSDPVTAAPVASVNLGKPAVAKGVITVNIDASLAGVPSGSYYVVVKAVGAAGTSAGAASGTFAL